MSAMLARSLMLSVFLITAVCGEHSGNLRAADESPTNQIVLRFDGIYQSEKTKDYYHYVRFYDDGCVITVSSTGTPDKIKKWFDRKKLDLSRGTYVITGTRIVFSADSKEGVVDYDGRLKGEQIEARVFSHINLNASNQSLKFVKVDFDAE